MLRSIDRKGYAAYKSLAGAYRFDAFTLVIDHVQGDPFAAPSSLHVELPHEVAGFPEALRCGDCERTALADHLTRLVGAAFAREGARREGSGKSGVVGISRCGQEVLRRSACEIGPRAITLRFTVGFPAYGRSINAEGLDRILFGLVPRCVRTCLVFRNIDKTRAAAAVQLAQDQKALREAISQEGLAAFVADGSVLPRESGVSPKPMEDAVPFSSPASLRRSFTLPHAGEVSGMAIPRGVTLIVGGGYHGKSTLLEALQNGVYDHRAGDGREFVVTDRSAVKLRAEDGRSIREVDISAFINDLPNGADTTSFSSLDASGSTSQAAAVSESVEAGVRLLLIDEDTSASNFMVRDELMQRVVARDKEPITPFIERVRGLYERAGVSTILVAGSSGAFFSVADLVVQMDAYRPEDVTERVREICAASGIVAEPSSDEAGRAPYEAPRRARLAPRFAGARGDKAWERRRNHGRGGEREHGGERGRGRSRKGDSEGRFVKARAQGRDSLSLDKETVDVRLVEQIVDSEQTLALAYLMRYGFAKLADGKRALVDVVDETFRVLEERGWGPFCGSYVPCGLAAPRRKELIACFNRYRG